MIDSEHADKYERGPGGARGREGKRARSRRFPGGPGQGGPGREERLTPASPTVPLTSGRPSRPGQVSGGAPLAVREMTPCNSPSCPSNRGTRSEERRVGQE